MQCSIVIPAYNASRFLATTIESALAQVNLDFVEVIIVDDGSTDATNAIANQFASSYPSTVRVLTTKNAGVGAARNTGLEHARCEFIQFLDADDLISPTKSCLQIKAMVETNTEFSLSNGVEIDEFGRVVGIVDASASLTPCMTVLNRMLLGGFFPPVAPLLKTENCRRISGFNTNRLMSGYADYEFFCRYLINFPSTSTIGVCPLFSYRRHQEGMSADHVSMNRAKALAFDRLCIQNSGAIMTAFDDINRYLSDILYANKYLNDALQQTQAIKGYLGAEVISRLVNSLKSNRISIWGCGSGGYRIAQLVNRFGGSIIAAFDSDPSKVGAIFFGVTIQEGLVRYIPRDSIVLVCTQFDVTRLVAQLQEAGLALLTIDFETLIPILEGGN